MKTSCRKRKYFEDSLNISAFSPSISLVMDTAVEKNDFDNFGQGAYQQGFYQPPPEFLSQTMQPNGQFVGVSGFEPINIFNNDQNGGPHNSGPYLGVPPPGFIPSISMGFYQMPPPMDDQFHGVPPWLGFQPPVIPGLPSYLAGQQMQPLMYRPWQRFEAPRPGMPKPDSTPMKYNKDDESANDPWWRNRMSGQGMQCPPFEFGTIGTFYSDKAAAEEKFQRQLFKFSAVPVEIHRKIQNMPGNEITDYFEVTVVRFRLGNIVESNLCHSLFTKKPETGQCWLMAFSIKDRFRTSIKFNRLLTSHLKVKVNGKTAVELQPSKLTQDHEGEFYVFNFIVENEANRFLEALDTARSQVWNHEHVDTARTFAHDLQAYNFLPNGNNGFQQLTGQLNNNEFLLGKRSFRNLSLRATGRGNILDSPIFRDSIRSGKFLSEKGTNESSTDKNQQNHEKRALPSVDDSIIKFRQPNTVVFVKCGKEYTPLGNGDLTIVTHENYFAEVMLIVGPNKEIVFNHYIYQWNRVELGKAECNFICKWSAAACMKNSPSELPVLREFKIEAETEEAVSNFFRTFYEEMGKAEELATAGSF